MIEESDKFKLKILTDYLGSVYIFRSSVCCSAKQGWLNRRSRFYACGFHRVYVTEVYPSLDNVLRIFERDLQCHWSVVAIAHTDDGLLAEIHEEQTWAISRPTATGKWLSDEDIMATYGDQGHEGKFAGALTHMESKHLRSYRNRESRDGRDPEARDQHCYNLTQNPETGFGIRSSFGKIPTLICNPGLHWCDSSPDGCSIGLGRWLSASEHLIIHLNPVLPWMSDPRDPRNGSEGHKWRRASSFQEGRASQSTRTRNDTIRMAGNGMNVMMVGYIQLYILIGAHSLGEGAVVQLFG